MEIWHNSRCSKSRSCLALIEKSGKQFTIRNYLEDAPKPDELLNLSKKLGCSLNEIIRKKEALYKELKVDTILENNTQLAKVLSENPKLIERPIVIKKNKALICRPPEKILDLL